MTELTNWLLEQIDADFECAGGGADGARIKRAVHDSLTCYTDDLLFVARWSPQRVLADCAAKRRIVEQYAPALDGDPNSVPLLTWILKLLALPYADRPGYLEEWRP